MTEKWNHKYFEWNDGPATTRIPFSSLEGVSEVNKNFTDYLIIIFRHGFLEKDDVYRRVNLSLIPGQLEAYLDWIDGHEAYRIVNGLNQG